MRCISLIFLWASLSSAFAQAPSGNSATDEWKSVTNILGKSGSLQDGVYKVGFPRTDLNVHIGETKVEPAAGLGSWMAFRGTRTEVIADGDLVLLTSEVNPVISALQSGGIEVTAIHNHLIGEEPEVMYLHFFGRGKVDALAETLKSALNGTKTPIAATAPSRPATPFQEQKTIEMNLGKAGMMNGKVLAFSFARSHPITMHKEMLAPAMGMATAINFQPSPKGVAATGDFVLRESEVQGVVAALRKGGIWVTAMHNHLLDDEPRMVFVHFWAEGAADGVSKTLRNALDAATSETK